MINTISARRELPGSAIPAAGMAKVPEVPKSTGFTVSDCIAKDGMSAMAENIRGKKTDNSGQTAILPAALEKALPLFWDILKCNTANGVYGSHPAIQ